MVAAAEPVGQLPMGSNATTVGIAAEVVAATVGRTSITAPVRAAAIPVGRNHPQVKNLIEHAMFCFIAGDILLSLLYGFLWDTYFYFCTRDIVICALQTYFRIRI